MSSSSSPLQLSLILYPDEVTVYRLDKDAQLHLPLNDIFATLKWFTISKTLDELSIIAPSSSSSTLILGDSGLDKTEGGWRVLKIDAVLDFGLVGILASIINPLKKADIPVFVVSTFDTDYILIKQLHLEDAKKAIQEDTSYSITLSQQSLV